MNSRQTEVLRFLRLGAISADLLGFRLHAPVPSMRRTIGELRRQGYRIRVDQLGIYRLEPEPITASPEVPDVPAATV